jgi:CHAD domain-containing protein
MPLAESAAIILSFRYGDSRKKAKRFLKESSVENLHSLRIAIRRLRYSLENFEACFSRSSFKSNIEYLKKLQDVIGVGRDLDVMKEKVAHLESECRTIIPRPFYECLSGKKDESLQEIKLELLKFLQNKKTRSFFTGKKED